MSVLPDDFRDLLLELRASGAEFVLIGGHAVAFHGHPRATKDLDVFVRPSAENARRVFEALARFGAPLAGLKISIDDFASSGQTVQLGMPPLRIDVLTRIEGISFDDAVREAGSFPLAGQQIPVIGLDALLANKRAAGRPQDLADVDALERRHGRR
jgi:hypothetical protein